jgi:hypothetical protein
MHKPLARSLLSAAAVFTLFSGPALAETVQITLNVTDEYRRDAYVNEHLLGEGWYFDGEAWVSEGEVDLGFSGGVESSWDDYTNIYYNALWLYPHSTTGIEARYWHDQGNYEYSNDVVSSNYYLGEDGALLYARRHVENPATGGYESYVYTTDWTGLPVSYFHEYEDGEGERISSDAPFDTDVLLANIRGDIPASRYGIFDFENSWIDYEGDGLGQISLAQLLETDVYGKYFAYFTGNAIDSLGWESAFPIASVGIVYNPVTAPPVPEPETWGMLLSGLGLMGLIARRRRKQA